MVMINIEDLIDRACRKFRVENVEVPLGLTKFSDYLRSLYPEHYKKIEEAPVQRTTNARAEICSRDICDYCVNHLLDDANDPCNDCLADFKNMYCLFEGRKLTPVA